ncbi:hypothetical protein DTO013E5_6463 [Penicillium roqueforti]|uniref:Genomic scaffold, ProqFM164S04 n=1 Tax=Penicillium roqueforti (strain FM164) TaxID=1365484 RepID=W6R1F6_PENRF|nr:uncharacterized protein LCP9604111_7456 [Penicillium roqueforti]CDM35657.1 unnamed protein product [Penicillium roqueforti FM164]KAF9244022.1 hypothetical protein LCP9604111_7456 [Penicillium roqueforti]KAI1831302.1 hypothetical protein CBS147337_7768 [Penicillium roqueforti]KAI2669694.1 hypothetical protein CBS147355_9748 [Penicillium roqueforti]KAI2672808.1 hypothetical protein LCP963914a_9309 [Penicillium roqueforti]
MYRPTIRNEWWLCIVLFTQAILTIALKTYILVEWQLWVTPTITQVPVAYMVPINLGVFIFASVYEFILALDAIHNKNNVLLFSICVCDACSFAYSIMQYIYMRGAITQLFDQRYGFPTLVDTTRNLWPQIQPAEIVVSIITGFCTLILCFVVYYLHREYSWVIYKSVHGSLKTRIRYLFYEIFLVLIKLLFYFLLGFIIQYNLVYVHFKEPEYTLTMFLIPASFIVMLLGIWLVQHERTIGVVGIITCYLGLLVYLISRIIILCGAVTAGKDIMLFFASVSVVLTSATILCAIICIKNFDRGFKAINQSKNGHAQESYSIPARNSPAEPSRPPSRLTLD